ncbi:1-aminocyclopropane-1-carboxylate oxidase [Amaranthus tricolor]|uniref:1-aminocyclopropane-1-carboxylate oxidase n=1 Tax=Amaranthus tricolor TaxID=29722 RepID=UPI00258EAA50|nr:1-aminocyclopropane-1-carboxylate oxidase [Amaranthus tricolor]
MLANSPLNLISKQENENHAFDFRAPPPSPIGSSRRASSVANDEVLTEFLEHSLRVPDLILPDRIFPRQNSFREITTVDFKLISSNDDGIIEKIQDTFSEIGCFQVINHGISRELIKSVVRRAGRVFRLSSEKKRMAVKLPEIGFGFEEVSGEVEDVSEIGEEFVWGKSSEFKLKMEGIWPTKFSKFSDKMESLASLIEKIGKEIVLKLIDDENDSAKNGKLSNDDNKNGCVCHMYKHPHDVTADECISSLRYDVIRMMINGSDYSHALSLHICDASSEFHVYSKKGWISFTPLQNALVVTAGDQIQTWSGGRYKQVIGKPIYTSKTKDCVSLAFLYSPTNTTTTSTKSTVRNVHCHEKGEKTISLRQQALFAIVFTIACQFLLHIYTRLSHP